MTVLMAEMILVVFDLINSSPNVSWVPCSFSPSRQKDEGKGGGANKKPKTQNQPTPHKNPPKPQTNKEPLKRPQQGTDPIYIVFKSKDRFNQEWILTNSCPMSLLSVPSRLNPSPLSAHSTALVQLPILAGTTEGGTWQPFHERLK